MKLDGLLREPVFYACFFWARLGPGSGFDDLEIVRDRDHLAEHGAGQTVFFGGEFHRLFDAPGVERLAGEGEMDVDPGVCRRLDV